MDFIRFFLIMLVPGIISSFVFYNVARIRRWPDINSTLIFDLLIFIVNITGLFFFKGIHTMTMLIASFDCLSFTRRYALLSILVGIILAVIFGIIARAFCRFRRRTS